MPRGGLGERWFRRSTGCEVRLSIPKTDGREGQRVLYVTHQFLRKNDILHIKYEGIIRQPEVGWIKNPTSPQSTTQVRQLATHIPWEIYDYDKTVSELSKIEGQALPICQCKQIN